MGTDMNEQMKRQPHFRELALVDLIYKVRRIEDDAHAERVRDFRTKRERQNYLRTHDPVRCN